MCNEDLKFYANKTQCEGSVTCLFPFEKSAAESQCVLTEAYVDYAPLISTCEYWFWYFKNRVFDLDNKEHLGQLKKFAVIKLEGLLDVNQY